jgi:hypothetical protein
MNEDYRSQTEHQELGSKNKGKKNRKKQANLTSNVQRHENTDDEWGDFTTFQKNITKKTKRSIEGIEEWDSINILKVSSSSKDSSSSLEGSLKGDQAASELSSKRKAKKKQKKATQPPYDTSSGEGKDSGTIYTQDVNQKAVLIDLSVEGQQSLNLLDALVAKVIEKIKEIKQREEKRMESEVKYAEPSMKEPDEESKNHSNQRNKFNHSGSHFFQGNANSSKTPIAPIVEEGDKECTLCLMVLKENAKGHLSTGGKAILQDKDGEKLYIQITVLQLDNGQQIQEKIQKAYINDILSKDPAVNSWWVRLKHRFQYICRNKLQVDYIQMLKDKIAEHEHNLQVEKESFTNMLKGEISKLEKEMEKKQKVYNESNSKCEQRRDQDLKEWNFAKEKLLFATTIKNALENNIELKTSVQSENDREKAILGKSQAKKYLATKNELSRLQSILTNADMDLKHVVDESLVYIHEGSKAHFETLTTGYCTELSYRIFCCKQANRGYWRGGIGFYGGTVTLLTTVSFGVYEGWYYKEHDVFSWQNLNCKNPNLNKTYKHGENSTYFYIQDAQQIMVIEQCTDGTFMPLSIGVYEDTKDHCFKTVDGSSNKPIPPYLNSSQRNETTLEWCENGVLKPLYKVNCEGESNASGQPVTQLNFTSSFNESLINARNKDIQMKWTRPQYLPVSEVEIGDKIYKILLGKKITLADLMRKIQVTHQEINRSNSTYSTSLKCSLSQNRCYSYLVTPIETPISVKINDTMIYKHQKENDVNDVVLIRGAYQVIYALPMVANDNQTMSLDEMMKGLGWAPEYDNNGFPQDCKAITKELMFKYNEKGTLSVAGVFPSNFAINGVGIYKEDIEQEFNQQLMNAKTFGKGTYGAFCQKLIKERGSNGFACDEIFTQEQIQAIIKKAILDKIALRKSTSTAKVNPNAVDLVNLTGGNATAQAEAKKFDAWRNQTLKNLNATMSSAFTPFTLFNIDDKQQVNVTCIAEESKRKLSVDNIDPRDSHRYQEKDLPLGVRKIIQNLVKNTGRGLEGDNSQQAFKKAGKDGKHNGEHNGCLKGGEDDEAIVINEGRKQNNGRKQSSGRGRM